jgi:hypothetical protein
MRQAAAEISLQKLGQYSIVNLHHLQPKRETNLPDSASVSKKPEALK